MNETVERHSTVRASQIMLNSLPRVLLMLPNLIIRNKREDSSSSQKTDRWIVYRCTWRIMCFWKNLSENKLLLVINAYNDA